MGCSYDVDGAVAKLQSPGPGRRCGRGRPRGSSLAIVHAASVRGSIRRARKLEVLKEATCGVVQLSHHSCGASLADAQKKPRPVRELSKEKLNDANFHWQLSSAWEMPSYCDGSRWKAAAPAICIRDFHALDTRCPSKLKSHSSTELNQTHHFNPERPSMFVHGRDRSRDPWTDRRRRRRPPSHCNAWSAPRHCCCCLSGPYRTWCLARCTHRQSKGTITWGALSLANPALHIPLPSSACSMVYFNVMGAVGTSTRADACALQADAQLPPPSAPSSLSFWSMVPGISGLSSIEGHTAQGASSPANPSSHMPLPESEDSTNQQSRSRVHWNLNHIEVIRLWQIQEFNLWQFNTNAPTYSCWSRPTETQTNNTSHLSYLVSSC